MSRPGDRSYSGRGISIALAIHSFDGRDLEIAPTTVDAGISIALAVHSFDGRDLEIAPTNVGVSVRLETA